MLRQSHHNNGSYPVLAVRSKAQKKVEIGDRALADDPTKCGVISLDICKALRLADPIQAVRRPSVSAKDDSGSNSINSWLRINRIFSGDRE